MMDSKHSEAFYDCLAMFEATFAKFSDYVEKNAQEARSTVNREISIARARNRQKMLIEKAGRDVYSKYKSGKEPVADREILEELAKTESELEGLLAKEESETEPKSNKQ